MATYIGTPTTIIYKITMNSFHHWDSVGEMALDDIISTILTGHSLNTIYSDEWITQFFPKKFSSLLDFGCGIGRNTFYYSMKYPKSKVVGYDSVKMLKRIDEFYLAKYEVPKPLNVSFDFHWPNISVQKFDIVVCLLVFQHIFEDDLLRYLFDLKRMTNFLIVSGRKFNDDNQKNTWGIIESAGLIPHFFYDTTISREVPYKLDYSDDSHHLALYSI